MSQENVGTTRQLVEAWSQGAGEALISFMDPEVEFHNPPHPIEPGLTRHGPDGIREVLRSVSNTFGEYDVEIVEIAGQGDQVAAQTKFRGRRRDGGPRKEDVASHIFRFRGRNVVIWRWFHEWQQALEAAGLRE